LPRIVRKRQWSAGFPLGLGLAILMYSRPYEGLVASLPAAVVLFIWLAREGIRGAVFQGLPTVAATMTVLAPAAAWLAFYHNAVTGDPLVMPYQVHDATYAACPLFLWKSAGAVPSYRHPEMADYYAGWERSHFVRKSAFCGLNSSAVTKLWTFLLFYVGAVFLLPLVALWRDCRDRWLWLAAATCGLVLLSLFFVTYLSAHYMAPVTGLVLVQVTAGMRRLRGWRWKRRRAGRWLTAAVIAVCALGYVVPLGATWYAGDHPRPRQQILRRLENDGSRHLVFVRYSPDHDCHREWVYNRADIDGSTVIWAREISAAEDRRLRDYYADRKAWVLIADEKPPRLLPYDDILVAAYPRRPNPRQP
jgi:hypothetical protein